MYVVVNQCGTYQSKIYGWQLHRENDKIITNAVSGGIHEYVHCERG